MSAVLDEVRPWLDAGAAPAAFFVKRSALLETKPLSELRCRATERHNLECAANKDRGMQRHHPGITRLAGLDGSGLKQQLLIPA